MKVTVRKWGNSAAIRIPAAVMEATKLRLDEEVDVFEEESRIVIQPRRQKTYRLTDLVRQIRADNLPEPADFGVSVGQEIL